MWIRMTRQVFVGGVPVFVGDVVACSEEDAGHLLAAGRGVVVRPEPPPSLPHSGGGADGSVGGDSPPPSLPQDGGGADGSVGGEWLADRLTAIRGIGGKTQEALNAAGVFTFRQLADADAESLAAALDGSSVGQVRRWQADCVGFLG